MIDEGAKLGSFKIEGILGSGAMGVVYRATHETTGREAAVKVIINEQGAKGNAYERFQREAQILQQFRHGNIVRFLAVGRYQGRSYFAMEYIEGKTLDKLVDDKAPLPWRDVVEMATQLCDALHYAHERGIVHRDLKPSNLMITPDGRLKLTDFGIAKDLDATALTATGRTIGTAAYMAPEQIRGTPEISHKTDLYALGIVLYQMLTGETPFQGTTAVVLMHAHMNQPPPKVSDKIPEIPKALDELILALMAKRPADRPWDAAAVGVTLGDLRDKAERKETIEMVWPDDKAAANPTRIGTKVKTRKRQESSHNWVEALEGRKVETGVLILALVTIVGFFTYKLWPESDGYLFTQAERLMQSDQREDWRRAREEYLDALDTKHPNHPYKDQVSTWRDRLDRADAEARSVYLDSGGVGGVPKDNLQRAYKETATRLKEDLSKYDEVGAANLWRDLAEKYAKSTEPTARGWRLMAEARATELDQTITRRRKEADEAMRMIVAADTARLTDQAIRSRREFVDRFSRFPYLAGRMPPQQDVANGHQPLERQTGRKIGPGPRPRRRP